MCPLSDPFHDAQDPVPAGAYAGLDELIRLRFQARDLKLARQKKVFSLLVGPHRARFRGRGIEFEEVRGYQAGDDIRGIDWRVTARTGKPHTRVFREERERPVLIVADQRSSMFFGSRSCFKSVLAAHAGALLSWAALQQSDRVGGLVFNGRDSTEIRPRRNVKTVLRFLNDLARFNHLLKRDFPEDDQGLDAALADLRRLARPGSNIFLISDFRGLTGHGEEQLHHLARHCDITAVLVHDPLERELPPGGYYSITDGIRRFTIFTGDAGLRRAYEEGFRRKTDRLRRLFGPLGIPLLQLVTGESPVRYFRNLLGGRR